jgi:hypothetical protein
LEYAGAYYTVNAARRLHRRQVAPFEAEWRKTFGWLAKAAGIPCLDYVDFVIHHWYVGSTPDHGAVFLAVKAAIDGITDAGVIPDDGPKHQRRQIFEAPIHASITQPPRVAIDIIKIIRP